MEIEQIEKEINNTKQMFDKMMEMNDYNYIHRIAIQLYVNQIEQLQYKKGIMSNG